MATLMATMRVMVLAMRMLMLMPVVIAMVMLTASVMVIMTAEVIVRERERERDIMNDIRRVCVVTAMHEGHTNLQLAFEYWPLPCPTS